MLVAANVCRQEVIQALSQVQAGKSLMWGPHGIRKEVDL